jgi:hypothetical protein
MGRRDTIGRIESALEAINRGLVAGIREMARERGIAEPAVPDLRRLILEEAEWDDKDPESDKVYGSKLRQLAADIPA